MAYYFCASIKNNLLSLNSLIFPRQQNVQQLDTGFIVLQKNKKERKDILGRKLKNTFSYVAFETGYGMGGLGKFPMHVAYTGVQIF